MTANYAQQKQGHDRTFTQNAVPESTGVVFFPSAIHIIDANVPFVPSVKILSVTLDSNVSMSQHISNTCKTA